MWNLLNKEVDLGEPTSFLDHVYLGMYSKTMWNKQRYCGQLQNHVWIANFSGGNRKTPIPSKIFVFLHGLMIWKVMQRNVWSDIVSWRTRRLNNSVKYLLHASMTIMSKKKNWNPLEKFQKYALKLFWNAYTWHMLEDLIFYGQWTNLQDRSQNGPNPVTNAWIDWLNLLYILKTGVPYTLTMTTELCPDAMGGRGEPLHQNTVKGPKASLADFRRVSNTRFQNHAFLLIKLILGFHAYRFLNEHCKQCVVENNCVW